MYTYEMYPGDMQISTYKTVGDMDVQETGIPIYTPTDVDMTICVPTYDVQWDEYEKEGGKPMSMWMDGVQGEEQIEGEDVQNGVEEKEEQIEEEEEEDVLMDGGVGSTAWDAWKYMLVENGLQTGESAVQSGNSEEKEDMQELEVEYVGEGAVDLQREEMQIADKAKVTSVEKTNAKQQVSERKTENILSSRMAAARKEKWFRTVTRTMPRDYQQELIDFCKVSNTIVVLPTGTGKTLVATHVILSNLKRHPLKKCVVLCPTVPLVHQQASVFADELPFPYNDGVAQVHGDSYKNNWQKIVSPASNVSVIVMTSQILHDELRDAALAGYDAMNRVMGNISLLVIDECHHTAKAHSYMRIMQNYFVPKRQTAGEDAVPRVLGLSASPSAKRTIGSTLTELAKLSYWLCSTVRTADDELLKPYAKMPNMVVREIPMEPESLKLYHTIEEAFKTTKAKLDQAMSAFGKKESVMLTENYVRAKQFSLLTSMLNETLIAVDTRSAWAAWQFLRDQIRSYSELFADLGLTEDSFHADTLPKYSTKTTALLNILDEYYNEEDQDISDNDSKSVIVFMKSRAGAHELKEFLEERLHGHPKLGILLGKEEMSDASQRQVVKEFKDGTISILIATSVAEEGIDITSCSLVIRMHSLNTALQMIQTRGRARHGTSRFLCLCHSDVSKDSNRAELCLTGEKKMKMAIKVLEEAETSLGVSLVEALYREPKPKPSTTPIFQYIWDYLGQEALADIIMPSDLEGEVVSLLNNTCEKQLDVRPTYSIVKEENGQQKGRKKYFEAKLEIDVPGFSMSWTARSGVSKKEVKMAVYEKAAIDFARRDLIIKTMQQEKMTKRLQVVSTTPALDHVKARDSEEDLKSELNSHKVVRMSNAKNIVIHYSQRKGLEGPKYILLTNDNFQFKCTLKVSDTEVVEAIGQCFSKKADAQKSSAIELIKKLPLFVVPATLASM